MSASLKFKEKNHYNESQIPESQDKVDVNDLVSRMKKEEKKVRRNWLTGPGPGFLFPLRQFPTVCACVNQFFCSIF